MITTQFHTDYIHSTFKTSLLSSLWTEVIACKSHAHGVCRSSLPVGSPDASPGPGCREGSCQRRHWGRWGRSPPAAENRQSCSPARCAAAQQKIVSTKHSHKHTMKMLENKRVGDIIIFYTQMKTGSSSNYWEEDALQTTHKWWRHKMAAAASCDVTGVKRFINSPDTVASKRIYI